MTKTYYWVVGKDYDDTDAEPILICRKDSLEEAVNAYAFEANMLKDDLAEPEEGYRRIEPTAIIQGVVLSGNGKPIKD